ncbi:MAG: hypothetical protein ACR2PI_00390 [Hyphomicrobiaceae bacterium]
MMKRIFLTIAMVTLTVSGAQAFEKTTSDGDQARPAEDVVKPLELAPEGSLNAGKDGSVVRIPGLGALGVLPKLDFGLELLYGDGQTQAVTPQEEESDTDGLRIRGTLKHRF